MTTTRKHILLVTVPAYGHIIPLLELGEKIAAFHDVTFAVSQFKMEESRRRDLLTSTTISFLDIPDGYFETADDASKSQVIFGKITNFVLPGAEKLFRNIHHNTVGTSSASEKSIDFVIADNMLSAVLPVLHERKIPFYLFNTASSAMTLQSLAINEDTPVIPQALAVSSEDMPFIEVPDPDAPPQPVPEVFKQLFLPMHKAAMLSAGIVENSAYELEPRVVDAIRRHPDMKNRPFWCVGPLMPNEKIDEAKAETQKRVKAFLDGKDYQSVIYISFGTVALPKPADIEAITRALLALERPFIWSMRKTDQALLPVELSSKINGQFQEGSNFLILNWAPQKLILQHPATAVFVSHCGWNSSVEGIACGVPVVGWPMFADQKLNALDLVDKGIGVLIQGTGMTVQSAVPFQTIFEAISRAGGLDSHEEDVDCRNAAWAWKAKLNEALGASGSSHKDFLELVAFKH